MAMYKRPRWVVCGAAASALVVALSPMNATALQEQAGELAGTSVEDVTTGESDAVSAAAISDISATGVSGGSDTEGSDEVEDAASDIADGIYDGESQASESNTLADAALSAKPEVTATLSGSSCQLSWKAVPGAARYAVAKRTDTGWYTYTYDLKATTFDLDSLDSGVTYEFLVQAYVDGQWTSFTDADVVEVTYVREPDPSRPKVKAEPEADSCELTWDAVPDATRYAVACRNGGGWHTFTYDCTDAHYTVEGLVPGQTYEFLVQACVNGAWSSFDDQDVVKVTTVAVPTRPQVTATLSGNSCDLSWDAIPGATRYAVAKRVGSGWSTYSYNVTSTSFHLDGLELGKPYDFLVQAYVGGSWSDFDDADVVRVTYVDPTSPANVQAVVTGDGEVTLSWNSVPNASRYAIAERIGSGWKTLTYDCDSTSYVVSDLVNGREHRFLIQAYVNGSWSPCSDSLCVSVTPQGTTKPRVTATPAGDGNLTLSWGKVPGATRYAVALRCGSTYKTYTYNETGTSFSVSGLEAGRPYYFLVQAYADGRWTDFSSDDLVAGVATGSASYISKPIYTVEYKSGAIYVNWDSVPNAQKYAVYVYKSSTGHYEAQSENVTDNYYVIRGLHAGYSYPILVQACRNGVWSSFTTDDLVSVTATDGKVGYQNRAGFYQVSSYNVRIPSAPSPFNYATPSGITIDATRSQCVETFIACARSYIGTPYIWDYACAPGVGVDCVGLVMQCCYSVGMDLSSSNFTWDFNPYNHYYGGSSGWHSHDANNLWDSPYAEHVSLGSRQRGDLISWPGHIAIYLGNDQIIEALPGSGVKYANLWRSGTGSIRGCIRLFQ